MAAADQDRDQAERRFRDLYQANFRPVQGYAVNRLGAADGAAVIAPNGATDGS